ncbi:MAG TPA: DUF4019 domain-containing protein [Terriglobales bacterium]|nr:DUF4019 domain-containing protein [Terriglobales bacterium]
MSIKCWFGLFCVVLLMISVTFSQTAAEKAAEEAATNWLGLIDSGDYGVSWEHAAQLFKSAISKEQWTEKISAVRAPLGKMNSRELKSASYQTSLPGAPDGQYVIIQYDSAFEHKKAALETITVMIDKDGQWRVSGYFIR